MEEVIRRIKSGIPGATRSKALDKQPVDLWQIQGLNPMARERLGYPTQKPEALLERIILASSVDKFETALERYGERMSKAAEERGNGLFSLKGIVVAFSFSKDATRKRHAPGVGAWRSS